MNFPYNERDILQLATKNKMNKEKQGSYYSELLRFVCFLNVVIQILSENLWERKCLYSFSELLKGKGDILPQFLKGRIMEEEKKSSLGKHFHAFA